MKENTAKFIDQGTDNSKISEEHSQQSISAEPIQADTIPTLKYPMRRFFARTIDLALFSLFWDFVLYIIMGMHYIDSNTIQYFSTFVVFVLLIFIEPILLSIFATTLGKWIFGLHLTDIHGRKPDYHKGLSRTWGVFAKGYGYNIPIYNLVQCYKCYMACKSGQELTWDKDFTYSIRDTKKHRYFACFAILSVIISLSVYISLLASCGTELIDISHYEPNPREGVSLDAEATSRKLWFTVSSDVIDYIIFDGFSGNISLEKKVDNTWFEVRKKLLVMDAAESVSPRQGCSNEICWKDYYGLNLDKGEYRLILTYWTSEFNDELYNAVAYFSIP